MATVEMITAGCKGDQEETTSSKENTPSVLSESNVNFSELTPLQFGISVESFTPASSSQRRGENGMGLLSVLDISFKYLVQSTYLPFPFYSR